MTRYLVAIMLVAPIVSAGELSTEPAVRAMFWQLLADARYGFSHVEEAAFVVRTSDGAYQCVAWPSDGLIDSARWEGRIPDGALAIVHTHPNWMSSPSSIDAKTARSTGVPVYVVTRERVTVTTGREQQVVVSGEWKPAAYARPCSRKAQLQAGGGATSTDDERSESLRR